MVNKILEKYSALVSAEPEGKDLFDKCSYFLPKEKKSTPKFLGDPPLTHLDLPEPASPPGPTPNRPQTDLHLGFCDPRPPLNLGFVTLYNLTCLALTCPY